MNTWSWSLISTLAAASLGSAAAIWWFKRRQQKILWFPILSVLKIPKKYMFRLTTSAPPLVSFLIFCLLGLCLLLFTIKPKMTIFEPLSGDEQRIHVLVDLSPSVSAETTIFEVGKKVSSLWSDVQKSAHLSLSTTWDARIFEPENAQDVEATLQKLNFHRAGARLQTTLREQLPALGKIDLLVIASDEDDYSWTGFSNAALANNLQVMHLPLGEKHAPGYYDANIFIHQVRLVSPLQSLSAEWEITLFRNDKGPRVEGNLQLFLADQALATTPWQFKDGQDQLIVQLSVLMTKLQSNAETPLVWKLSASGDDKLLLDNEFRTLSLGRSLHAEIFAPPAGEFLLEEPSYPLQIALSTQGFNVSRRDKAPPAQPIERATAPDLAVLVGGQGLEPEIFCPSHLHLSQLKQHKGSNYRLQHVWLVPYSAEPNYEELCGCFYRLIIQENPHEAAPAYCSKITSKALWTDLLQSLGAKQMGGELGQLDQAVAMSIKDKEGLLDVTAFTIPLTPVRALGVSHSTLPLLVRELLQRSNLRLSRDLYQEDGWPRISDLADASKLAKQKDIELSNVPVGESLLHRIDSQLLPPPLRQVGENKNAATSLRKVTQEPKPWVWGVAIAVLCLLLADFAATFLKINPRRLFTLIFFFLSSGFFCTQEGSAQVSLALLRHKSEKVSFVSLSKEVASRTSISLSPEPVILHDMDQNSGPVPLLWTESLDALLGKNGELKPAMVTALLQGGLLVIEQDVRQEKLDQAVKPLLSANAPKAWQPVPPDHELMRSFYLLEALPSCKEQLWKVFSFDHRVGILQIPTGLLRYVQDQRAEGGCEALQQTEYLYRTVVNILMAALATDYKKDQIHLPEILKRLR